MKPMLIPTVGETVRCIRDSLADVIAPQLSTQSLRSSMGSTLALLNYVECRVENEGQMLYDEIKHLRDLFAKVLVFTNQLPEAGKLAAAIRLILGTNRGPDVYPSLRLLAEDIGQMRQHVCDALLLVQSMSGTESEQLREEIHRYTAWQIVQEEKMMAAAFRGRGPRR